MINIWCFATVIRKQVNFQHSTQFMVRTDEGSVIYLYTKFEADCSIRSKVACRGPKISKLCQVTSATPIWGSVCVPYAERVHLLFVYQI